MTSIPARQPAIDASIEVGRGFMPDGQRSDAPINCIVRSEELLHGQPVLHIEHNGALYQLRATRLGKLILTK
jgi:hemin uptake protein HemP